MKYFLLSLLFLNQVAGAQIACEQWFPYAVGEGFQLETRDPGGEANGSIRFTVLDITRSGERVIYTVKRDIRDNATGEGTSVEYTMECDDDKMYIDTRALYYPAQASAMEGMETEVESDDLVMPASLQVGDELPDASLTMTMKMEGTVFTTLKMTFTGKKVISRESLTVPAGTFSCLKIEGKMNMEMKVMDKPMNFSTKTIQWYAEGTGMVQGESYDESGELSGSLVLTEKF
ncbi:hypothetical protein EDD80_101449 [Anseongella ginsenosidimutans]|uniref:DUF3108 domain-containing protein n=1 Tax=Anseongella ginsenosidimutans TaxID=496056 RepID=A0A4R3KWT0_9SPHI|nr:hypothetical protein [Anseongella ginsenosidimutans]QEC51090.1 hypothetical protein FRZ59_01130 [Anseongella ginsenosidimutans]TCS90249.1 hypothetical protein EDD80_101449 [Anseongella ginsenosidimutans]